MKIACLAHLKFHEIRGYLCIRKMTAQTQGVMCGISFVSAANEFSSR